MLALVPQCEPAPVAPRQVRSNCPDCKADLEVLRVIAGRSAEYWTMRCTNCRGIHLDIVDVPRD
jgi:uncharacterized Zn finger protein